ncbi:hypothetical protein [Rhodopirellula sp. MGV]|uniref:hypothetical protein n=1 Tax=Rhodopirellula sp. MGV TaxID=2023130 RepID=UPI000B97AAE3|nr:hypothetical protein [Rhodopirellula sp. MGV]OYP32327.1 hypothetical protein CGZ80_19870 [Rhodopirellula sp. MGV]
MSKMTSPIDATQTQSVRRRAFRQYSKAFSTFGTSVAAVTLLSLIGCASDRFCGSCPDECPEACTTDCLPKTVGQSMPVAMVADWQKCVEAIPNDAVPAPPGTYLEAWRAAQVTRAQQQKWVITRNEWFDRGDQLSPDGLKHIARLSDALKLSPNWVVIENEPMLLASDEEYADATKRIEELHNRRRVVVVEHLAGLGIPDADQWVVFADDRSVGVRGVEAPTVFNRMFQGSGRRSRGGMGRGGFGSGNSGAGFGGGGGFGGGYGGGMGGGGMF